MASLAAAGLSLLTFARGGLIERIVASSEVDVVCRVRELSSTADAGPLHQLSPSSSPFVPDGSRSSVGGTTTLLLASRTLRDANDAIEGTWEESRTIGTSARRPSVRMAPSWSRTGGGPLVCRRSLVPASTVRAVRARSNA